MIPRALIYSGIPSAVALAIAFAATFWTPNRTFRSLLLHFAAGVVFAVAATNLLPEAMGLHHLVWLIVGFAVGVLIMLAVEWVEEGAGPGSQDEKERRASAAKDRTGTPRGAFGLIAGDAVDQVVSGLTLGISIAAGSHVGGLLSVAMTIEDVSFGFAIATVMRASGSGRSGIMLATAALGGEFIALTIAAALLLPAHNEALRTFILAVGSGALLYVVTEQLLVDAHEQRNAPLIALGFFAGFLLLLILGQVSLG